MDNITKEEIIKTLKESETVLITTHNKPYLPVINRIYKKMIHGLKFDDIKVCETLIIDGHHRYVSSIVAKIKLDQAKSAMTSATTTYDWMEVEFLQEEWDTADKIKRLNELDAAFNNISIEKIIEIIK